MISKDAEPTDIILINPVWKAYYEFIVGGVILLYFFGLGLLVFLYAWRDMRRRSYKITPKRVIAFQGKTATELPISKIKSIYVSQDAIRRALDVGNVRIVSTDGDALTIKYIPHPAQLKKLLEKYRAAGAAPSSQKA